MPLDLQDSCVSHRSARYTLWSSLLWPDETRFDRPYSKALEGGVWCQALHALPRCHFPSTAERRPCSSTHEVVLESVRPSCDREGRNSMLPGKPDHQASRVPEQMPRDYCRCPQARAAAGCISVWRCQSDSQFSAGGNPCRLRQFVLLCCRRYVFSADLTLSVPSPLLLCFCLATSSSAASF